MKTTSALCVFPFMQTIELMKPISSGKSIYWKAEATKDTLTVCTWCGDDQCQGRVLNTLPSNQCLDDDPVQEMWRRATDKLEKQNFHFINGR